MTVARAIGVKEASVSETATGRDRRGPDQPTKDPPMTTVTQPQLFAYAVEDAPRGQKSYWTRIGRLFPHKDGKGYDIVLNALPINGRIVVRQEEAKDEAPATN